MEEGAVVILKRNGNDILSKIFPETCLSLICEY